MTDELRKAAQALIAEWDGDVSMNRLLNRVEDMRNVLAKPVAAHDDAIDWEGVAADQAMTIAMMKVDYQQLQALVTSQGIRLMDSEGVPEPMQRIHDFGREQEAREDAPVACEWTHDADGFYKADCGNADWIPDDDPPERYMTYCYGCGKRIRFI